MKLSWKDCLKGGVTIFALYLCVHYWQSVAVLAKAILSAGMPLVIGCVIAYLVNILMSSYEKSYFPNAKNRFLIMTRRPLCLLLAFLTLIAIIVLVVLLIVPQLGDCFRIIMNAIPGAMQAVIDFVEQQNILSAETIKSLETIDWQSRIGQIVEVVTSGLGSVVDVVFSLVGSVFYWVVTIFVSLIFSVYLLSGKERIGRQFSSLLRRYLPERVNNTVRYVLDIFNDCFRRYIVGQCTEAVILGLLCCIGMAILQLPYAMMIGALIAFTALIPIAGAYIGAGVGAFMILMVDPFKALIFLTFILVLQQLEGNLIYPRVVGSSMGLPGIWVLAAVTIGGGIMGIVGMLLGVPVAAAIYRLLANDVRKADAPEATELPTEEPTE